MTDLRYVIPGRFRERFTWMDEFTSQMVAASGQNVEGERQKLLCIHG